MSTPSALFIAPIYHLEVRDKLGRGDQLHDGLFLTNDTEFIASLLQPRFKHRIGEIEYENLRRAKMVAYSKTTSAEIDENPAATENHVAVQLGTLHPFLTMLWLVKDNSASVENGFVFATEFASTRLWSCRNYGASGHYVDEPFTRTELRQARTLFTALYDQSDFESRTFDTFHGPEVTSSEAPPLSRALFFLSAGRTCAHLSVKIANYCTALEALLMAYASSELTFRLSQRVALLLGETADERLELFNQMRAIYEIRSKAVHGSTLSTKRVEKDLPATVVHADQIVRGVIQTVLQNDMLREFVTGKAKNAEAFERYFLELCLSFPTPVEPRE